MSSNIEPIAREIVRRICDDPAWVDRHWPCVAAELEAGLIDETGRQLPGYSLERGLEAYRERLSRA